VPRTRNWFRRMFAFAGPAYLVSVGYMDPGNWATDLQGGAKFGYQLVWVLVMSNLMAVLLQTLSARLGVVTGRDLAQACRDFYPRFMVWPLWILCEIAIVACDLAEVLGAAIGLQLLFGIPLLVGVIVTALDVLLLLVLSNYGMRGWKRSSSCSWSRSAAASRRRWRCRSRTSPRSSTPCCRATPPASWRCSRARPTAASPCSGSTPSRCSSPWASSAPR
jgi:hypothetical protein